VQLFRYVRIYSNGEGESDFEDVGAVMGLGSSRGLLRRLTEPLGAASEISLAGARSDWGGPGVVKAYLRPQRLERTMTPCSLRRLRRS
jgi:hypothetical protein